MRCLVLSDIHSNLNALEAVLADAGSFDQIWCVGDIIGYGPQPNECIERLRSFPHLCVAGNHDWAATDMLDVSNFNPDALRACLWTREQLTPRNYAYIAGLPERFTIGRFTIVHGSPRQPIWEYITHLSIAAANVARFDTPYCLFGHTHIPAVYSFCGFPQKGNELTPVLNEAMPLRDERLMLNPGGVGQPRDGDPRASYVLLDTEVNTVEYRRVAYSVQETQELMLSLGLPRRLAARLSLGW